MAGLRTLLGLYPKTSEYENNRKKLADEFSALNEFETSDDLARYKELQQYIKSAEFESQKKELLTLKYKNSDEYKKENEYNRLKSDSEIKLYFKTLDSPLLSNYSEIVKSDKLKRYQELEAFINSVDFKKVVDYYKQSGKTRFSQSDLGKSLANYQHLSTSDKIKGYFKFVGHKNFNDFETINKSKKLKQYEELKELVESHQFAAKKSSMKKADFNASPEGQQYHEYLILSKSKDIKNYFALLKLPNKKYYEELKGSNELEAYNELEKFIHSLDFKNQRAAIEKKTFKDTDEFVKQQEFNQLKSDSKLKQYFAFIKSKEFNNYNTIIESTKLERYHELKAYIGGEAFNEKKKYLTMSPKTRWKLSEPFARLQEYEALEKSEKIVWYLKNREHKKFSWFRTWQLTFDDDFDTGKIDKNKWLTRYFWGDKFLNDTYSLAHEKHCITEGNNLEFNGSVLKIVTKKGKTEGKIWDPELGFRPHEFDYSSGLINTGKSFRQLHGLFEAKIKISNNPQILNAFWMVGDSMLPQIDIINAQHKCTLGVYNQNSRFNKSLGRSKFSADYYIYSIEWDAEKIIWKINGLEVATLKNDLPQEPMYFNLNAGLYEEVNSNLPTTMEIDWVRCYKKR